LQPNNLNGTRTILPLTVPNVGQRSIIVNGRGLPTKIGAPDPGFFRIHSALSHACF